jgi:hypothetical protein
LDNDDAVGGATGDVGIDNDMDSDMDIDIVVVVVVVDVVVVVVVVVVGYNISVEDFVPVVVGLLFCPS